MTVALAGLPALAREETQLQLVRGPAFGNPVSTQTEVDQAFHEILTEINQMAKAL